MLVAAATKQLGHDTQNGDATVLKQAISMSLEPWNAIAPATPPQSPSTDVMTEEEIHAMVQKALICLTTNACVAAACVNMCQNHIAPLYDSMTALQVEQFLQVAETDSDDVSRWKSRLQRMIEAGDINYIESVSEEVATV